MLSLLRDAPWLTARRVRDYAAILIAFDLLAIASSRTGSGVNDPSGKPIGTDFVSFWTVSLALHHGDAAAVYQPLHLAALEQPLTAAPISFTPGPIRRSRCSSSRRWRSCLISGRSRDGSSSASRFIFKPCGASCRAASPSRPASPFPRF